MFSNTNSTKYSTKNILVFSFVGVVVLVAFGLLISLGKDLTNRSEKTNKVNNPSTVIDNADKSEPKYPDYLANPGSSGDSTEKDVAEDESDTNSSNVPADNQEDLGTDDGNDPAFEEEPELPDDSEFTEESDIPDEPELPDEPI